MHRDPTPTWTRRQVISALCGAATVAAVGGTLAGCSGPGDEPVDDDAAVPGAIDVSTFGAVGDGRTDDTQAVQRALDSLHSKQILQFPAGRVFCHSDVLTLHRPDVQLVGPGELRATEERRSAFQVAASGVTIHDLTFGIRATTRRWSTPDQHKLFIGQVSGVTVRDVRITGSAAAGLFALGTSNFDFETVTVSDTRADGIHLTYGAHSGTVAHPVITRSGDDGVAVVSYLQDGRVCHDIEIVQPTVRSTTGGRGLSVVGGHDISYRDIVVDRSSAAAVYIACEGDPSDTCDTHRVTVTNGTISGANTDAAVDHGAVLVYSGRGGGTVDDVQISGLAISDTRSDASRQIGVIADSAGDGVANVRFEDLRLADGPTPYEGNVPLAAVRLQAVTAGGRAVATSVSR